LDYFAGAKKREIAASALQPPRNDSKENATTDVIANEALAK